MNFVYGVLFGLTLQLGLGPVNIATWIFGITHGWRKSLLVSLGVALVDWIFIIVSYVYINSIKQYHIAEILLYVTSAGFLFFLGVNSLVKWKDTEDEAEFIFKGNLLTAGFKVNIVNPKAIVLWVAVITSIKMPDVLFILAIPVSTVIWLGLMPFIFMQVLNKLTRIITVDKFIVTLRKDAHYIIGLVFLFYGGFACYKLLLIM